MGAAPKRDINICRIRKFYGLSCRNCECFSYCEEVKGIKPPKKPKQKTRRGRLTPEEADIVKDVDIPVSKAMELTGRSAKAIIDYRTKHNLYKVIKKEEL